jgi:protein SCO1/2
MPRLRSTAICTLALVAGCARTGGLRVEAPPEEPPRSAPELALRPGRAAMPALPNLPVLTHRGETVRFYDDLVRGKIVLLSFTYTRCNGSCPRSTANLVRVQRLLGERVGRDVFILSLTLDPENDTPEALRRHAEAIGAGPGWTFVTGTKEVMEHLRQALGFTDPDPVVDADRTNHALVVKVGDDRTGRWGAVPGVIDAELIVDALHRAAREPYARWGPGTEG